MTAVLETQPAVLPGTTHLPPAAGEVAPTPRSDIGALPAETRFVLWGSRVAALGLTWVVCERLLPLPGVAWFVLVLAATNLLLLAVATWMTEDAVTVRDRVAQWLVSAGALVVFGALASVVLFVLQRGWGALHHVNFFTTDMTGIGPSDPLDRGGILHAMLGTLIELSIAVAVTLPLGIGTAVFMNEIGGRFARVVRTVVEAMTALPSIVAGLFVYTTWIIALGMPRSGLAAGLAISVMMLPIIARAADVVLRVVPGNLREASLALGASRWKTVWHVVLPTARPGLATALILGVARGAGETSPVLISSGYAPFVHLDPSTGVMTSLPLSIYVNVRSGQDLMIARGFGTAATLLGIVLVLFVVARLLARPPGARAGAGRRLVRRLAGGRSRRPVPATPTTPAPDGPAAANATPTRAARPSRKLTRP